MLRTAVIRVAELEVLERFDSVEASTDKHDHAIADVESLQPMRDHKEGQAPS